jgi:hypothetical protein
MYIPIAARQLRTETIENVKKLGSICTDIADKINKAYYFGIGFRQNVSLPETMHGFEYTIIVNDNRTIICNTSTDYSIETFVASSVTNTTDNPPFLIPIKEIQILNSDGVIVIS